jgi:phosphoribosylaminoimidazole-succinocarboxamide synthase
MKVRKAQKLGQGLEVICRYRAVGSFIRRYGMYIESGTPLPAYVEMTLKSDERGDPPITKEGLELFGILKPSEYETLVILTQKICQVIKDDLAGKGLELYDIKLEFGRCEGKLTLIDEISVGVMRVFKGTEQVLPLELTGLVLGKDKA